MPFGTAKARRARESLLGVKPIPGDPFSESRKAISETAKLLKVFDDTVESFSKRISNLQSVNDELTSALHELGNNDMNIPFKELNHAVMDCKPKLDALRLHLHAFGEKAEMTEQALVERDKKFWDKQHYEDKINKLTDDQKFNNEFMDRNVKKRSHSITVYAETEKSLREAQLVASAIPDVLDSAACMYSEYLDELFGAFSNKPNPREKSLDSTAVMYPPIVNV